MKVTVIGLWHLGSVTAACCAEHFSVVGLDFDPVVLARLRDGRAPVMEPGLDDLLAEGLASGRLTFEDNPFSACAEADVLWVCDDTPVNDDDEADVEHVLDRVRRCAPHLPAGAVMVVSSQLPVGTCRQLESEFPRIAVACAPENLRLGKALDIFRNPDRIVIGVRDKTVQAKLDPLFSTWSRHLLWMLPESAEMTKHGINSFLALSIAFMNELARLCEATGADASEVERGLKSESRIGPGAYLRAGGAFAGGTLARDVVTLTRISKSGGEVLSLIPAIKDSNDRHKWWALNKLQRELGDLQGRCIAVLGLTYKPGTDTLRRSMAVELCGALMDAGAHVRAYDPSIIAKPPEIGDAAFCTRIADAIVGTDAAVVCTEWPEIKSANWPALIATMRTPLILDANEFLPAAETADARRIRVGSPA